MAWIAGQQPSGGVAAGGDEANVRITNMKRNLVGITVGQFRRVIREIKDMCKSYDDIRDLITRYFHCHDLTLAYLDIIDDAEKDGYEIWKDDDFIKELRKMVIIQHKEYFEKMNENLFHLVDMLEDAEGEQTIIAAADMSELLKKRDTP